MAKPNWWTAAKEVTNIEKPTDPVVLKIVYGRMSE